MVIPKCDYEVSEEHSADVGNESGQSHLWFSDAAIPLGCSGSNPNGEFTIGNKNDEGANQWSKVRKADRLTGKAVRRWSEILGTHQVDIQETAGRPRHDEGDELNDREGKQPPGDPEVPGKSLDSTFTRHE